jgi:AraC-like DNA-binding protein
MEVVFLFGTVQAIFLSILIFTKKNKTRGDYVLGSWMVFLGLHLLDHYFHSTGLAWKYPHLLGIGIFFPMLEGPFMFVYVLVLINGTNRFKPIYLIHGLPFIFVILYLMFNFYFLPTSEKISYYHIFTAKLTLASKLVFSLNVFLGPIYVIWSLIKLKKYTQNIAEQFSFTEQINLNWLKYVIAGLGFVWITVILGVTLSIFFPVISIDLSNWFIYLSVTIAVFLLGFFGLRQKAIYVNVPDIILENKSNEGQREEELKERYKKSGLSDMKAKEYQTRLLQYMKEEKPYLNGKLSLNDIATHLNMSINHLSQVINGHLGISFFDFVNKYRVNEVKLKLSNQEHQHITLLAIAFDCGFNSKSSFNKIFKKNTGYTPSGFIKTIMP